MSGWDLSGMPEGLILNLAKELEAEWLGMGAGAAGHSDLRDAPCAPELKSVDAMAPDGDPATRIRIENLCLQTDVFRKMHLEAGTSEQCSPRHRMSFDAKNEGSKCGG